MLDHQAIIDAYTRIKDKVHQPPIMESTLLNEWLGHRILFKPECLQKTGAFKFRGATNVLARLQQENALPERIVANSSGNHAQAIAYAAATFNIPATIYTINSVSKVKAAATESYGAKVIKFETRVEADAAVKAAAEQKGTLWIPPFDHPDIIAGQGTACYEALHQVEDRVNAVFAPCGGGGLLSGTLLAAKGYCEDIQVIGAEPLNANDAARSLRSGKIESLDGPPVTLADGAATPAVGQHTFPLLQKTDAFYEVEENRIAYWTQWLQHLLKLHIEPTCAMTMEAVVNWLKESKPSQVQTCLVILSGGNIDQQKMAQVWREDHLHQSPTLN
ncbi:serine/threonine dehydratase [Planctobacterium marinum]|uniref:Serine/threonine dehydratase n=1 Tax=Planctobacterium marinum TaxID=1631968 RepID=A0AA48HP95_9ALTE|nr:serine/threonine dehydratase [Planctobacterium marinum]